MVKIRLNKEKRSVLKVVEEGSNNVFLTGRAGTGKSTLLGRFKQSTKKNVVVLAPTGIAALNVRGQTIHSFFGFRPNITPGKVEKVYNSRRIHLYKKLDSVVIDEVSMVRADLLDCIDKFLRLNGGKPDMPFGGAQMIFMGDLYQLPPVVTDKEKEFFCRRYESPYFFDADSYKDIDVTYIQLNRVFRQKEKEFVHILNRIRNGSIKKSDLDLLNQRYAPDCPIETLNSHIYLATTNKRAEELNSEMLSKLPGEPFRLHGSIIGNFPPERLPTQIDLELKVGARVMFLNNDTGGWWVNGDLGNIVEIKKENGRVFLSAKIDGKSGVYPLIPHSWDIVKFVFDEKNGKVDTVITGSFMQYPIKLGWAVTIHKSQGKTYDKVVVDFCRGTFAPGQAYVALSRCTSLDGLILREPITANHVFTDTRIEEFMKKAGFIT